MCVCVRESTREPFVCVCVCVCVCVSKGMLKPCVLQGWSGDIHEPCVCIRVSRVVYVSACKRV